MLQSLHGHADLVAADIDPFAVGLYLVPPNRGCCSLAATTPLRAHAARTAIHYGADLVIPTVDTELRGVSAAREEFAEHGIALLVESTHTLDLCLDKLVLVAHCADTVRVPRTMAI